MEMVVATKKRYNLSPSGKLQKEFVTEVRKDMVVEKSYVDVINNQTEQHGVFFEIDQEKTEAFYVELEKSNKEKQEAKDLEKALALSQLKNAASVAQKAVVESLEEKPKRGRKPKTEE